jgi:hypothetical protein
MSVLKRPKILLNDVYKLNLFFRSSWQFYIKLNQLINLIVFKPQYYLSYYLEFVFRFFAFLVTIIRFAFLKFNEN